jgi:chromosome segregation ATPase
MRIYQISQRLQEIAKERESERIVSLNQIDALLKEVESLRAELSTLKNQSSGLSQYSETTASQYGEQAKEIARLAVLAESLKASFKTYRDSAKEKIKRLEKSLRFHKVIEKAAIAAALVFGGLWASSTL